jgi:hypothetical protein
MLIFIGGAARTGKGILARRILVEMLVPFLSLDVLKMGLARGVPEYLIDPDAGGRQVAERLWPLVREMSNSLLREGIDYGFEGEILPKDVDVLRQVYPNQVQACFLGYNTINASKKLDEIRRHTGHPNDWPREYCDADLLTIIQREIAFSEFLQEECARVDIRYFDTSQNFLGVLDEVAAYLKSVR